MKRERSAGAIVFKKGKDIKYLLLHYEAGHWDFPKGNIEPDETELETVNREIIEETGIKNIQFVNRFREKMYYFYKSKDKLISKEVVFYLAKTTVKEVKLSFEHIGYAWLSYEEAINKLTYKNAKEILKNANEFLKKYKTLEDFSQ